MLWQGNKTCRFLTTVLLAVTVCVAGPVHGQSKPPDAEEVAAAWVKLQEWLLAFDLPSPEDPASKVGITSGSAVCILLRRDGRLISYGADTTGDDLMLRRAAARAFGGVLADPEVASLPERSRDEVGFRLTMEFEVAGEPRPLLGRTYSEATRRLQPGIEGVALRHGEDWAMLFPSLTLATGRAANLDLAMPRLAADLELPAAELPELQREHGVQVYRFVTIHLAQSKPIGAPFETYRGDVLVPASAVTIPGTAETTDALARHLLVTRFQPDPNGEPEKLVFRGDYIPVVDTFEPARALPLEQALLYLAMHRYGRTPGVDTTLAAEATEAARAALLGFARVERGEIDPLKDPLAAAAFVHAATEILPAMNNPMVDRIVRVAATRIQNLTEPQMQKVDDPHSRALIAGALARLLTLPDPPVKVEVARTALDEAWASAPGSRAISLLPWIGWAEQDYARATGEPIRNALQLQQLRAALDQLRIGGAKVPGPRDIAGGFVLSGRLRKPLATDQSLRPATWLASMLRDPALTPPGEFAGHLGRFLKTIRFIMQLSVRETATWRLRAPERALGGLRASTWDEREPAAAQAMGLLALSETLISIDDLLGKRNSRGSDQSN